MRARGPKPLMMPASGVIKGGRLDGWRFHFLQFRVSAEGELLVLARCSAPNWPFPCDIPLDPTHFRQLRAVPGERAKRLAAAPLIAAAYGHAGRPAPAWLTAEKVMTLRASVKRSHQPSARRTRGRHDA